MMKSTAFILIALLGGSFVPSAMAADLLPGRYQALVMGQGTHVFILDTKDGHSWGFDLNDNQLRYYGKVHPGEKPGEVLAAAAGMTIEQRLDELKTDLKEEIEALKKAMVQPEGGAEGALSRTDVQKAMARAKLRREIKEEIKRAIEQEDLKDEVKADLKRIIDELD